VLRGLVFAAKTFAAATLTFVLAQWLNMPRPHWARRSQVRANSSLREAEHVLPAAL
jgi:hypothetical protein